MIFPNNSSQIIYPEIPPIMPEAMNVSLCRSGMNVKITIREITHPIKAVTNVILQISQPKYFEIFTSSLFVERFPVIK